MTVQTQESTSSINQIRQTRIQKLADLADKGVNPYPYKFEKTISCCFDGYAGCGCNADEHIHHHRKRGYKWVLYLYCFKR